MTTTKPLLYSSSADGAKILTVAGYFCVKVEADQTDGEYAVLLGSIPAGGSTPALHAHPFAETFYVLSGRFEFETLGARGHEIIRPSAGDVLYVPSDTPHTFRNAGLTTGTLLVVAAPVLVEFLREIEANALDEGILDMTRAAPILAKYGMRTVDPARIAA